MHLIQEIMTEKVSFPVQTRHVINAKDDISFFLQVVLELGSSKPNPIQISLIWACALSQEVMTDKVVLFIKWLQDICSNKSLFLQDI